MKNLLLSKGESISIEQRESLPIKFTNPFSYTPHSLCIEAAEDVRRYLRETLHLSESKMFGVLVTESPLGEIGYFAAFSGNLLGSNNFDFFVPPVYDLLNPDDFFKVGEREISQINCEIESLLANSEYVALLVEVKTLRTKIDSKLQELKEEYHLSKKLRSEKRCILTADFAQGKISEPEFKTALSVLVRESQFQKAEMKRVEERLKQELSVFKSRLDVHNMRINELKQLRKERSAALQQRIFENFKFLNAKGETASLLDIFNGNPPAGAGECAAPKLLQYAYKNGYRPIVMGEFWWGDSPVGEIRKHGEFYPSCKSKCEPILKFMLQGLDVDSANFHTSYGCDCESFGLRNIEVLYEDEYILAVNKPAGILSVPGKNATEPSIMELYNFKPAHRLDMHTSGVLLLAKNDNVYKDLQKQFACGEVKKCYNAVLEGIVQPLKCGNAVKFTDNSNTQGTISLPLIPDYENRPRQMVDFQNGKEAVTNFKIIKFENNRTFIEFYPKTGRTHQLRVHSAHQFGLNTPIVGDLLYGKADKRLMLQAKSVEFTHPSKGVITITAKSILF